MPDWAGATPLFRLPATQKVRGVAPARHAGSVTVFCPRARRELLRKTNEVIFSVGDTLISNRAEETNRGRTGLFSEAQMANHTDHKLTRQPLRRTQLGSVSADFLHRAGGESAFLCTFRNSRGEESFTPVLHGALHRSLHPSAARKARQVNQMDVPKTVGLREGWNAVRAGATPPFDARCVTVAVRALPPSQELRVSLLRGCIHRPENLSDRRLTVCMKTKGEARCLY